VIFKGEIVFLTLEQVLAINYDQIERYGGSHGLRSVELLESAVFRSGMVFGGKDLYPDVFYKAAALMHSLILNHAFVDGNKRTGMVAGIVFLRVNNCRVELSKSDLIEVALKIGKNEWKIREIAIWLKENSVNVG
jgi:death on curing protein